MHDEGELFSLPLYMAGYIANPVSTSPLLFDSSVISFEYDSHVSAVLSSRLLDCHQLYQRRFDELLLSFAILHAKEFNLSSWLSVLPFVRPFLTCQLNSFGMIWP